jgi:hypothetical protein
MWRLWGKKISEKIIGVILGISKVEVTIENGKAVVESQKTNYQRTNN